MIKFYDTCSLLSLLQAAFKDDEQFIISNITLKELEHIKTSVNKDADVKFRARRLLHLLANNEDKYTVKAYLNAYDDKIKDIAILSDNDDSKIIYSAYQENQHHDDLVFVTEDLNCKLIAKVLGLNVEYVQNAVAADYKGFKTIQCNSDEELANLYENIYNKDNLWDFKINEYLIIQDKDGNNIDKYKYTSEGFEKVPFTCFESKAFGKIKPKDEYQLLAMNSFKTNQITMIRGAAGTGKSYLALGYLFSKLDKGEIDKIIIFCNTVATSGSAKLGYYPGSRTEKLLDSQIGNFLTSKLGSRIEVERLIDDNKLDLLPMSDIRGYDTGGMKAGVYITEAQNLDIELMKLALQRISEDAICILDGDTEAQVDLNIYAGNNNGMRRVSEVFRGDPIYGEVTLQHIYRSRISQLAELMQHLAAARLVVAS